MKVKSLSHVQLFTTPWTVVYQAPPSMGFSSQEYWSALPFPFPEDLPNPKIKLRSPALQADALPSEPPGKLEVPTRDTEGEMGKILDVLQENHKIIVMSTRGHGRSEIGHSPLTYKQKADDAIAVLNSVGEKSVKILGFSDGAYTAYEIAALYPEKVERIVAIGAGTLQKGFFHDKMSLTDLEKFDSKFIEEQKKIRPEPERWQEFCDKYMKFWHEMSVGEETFSKIKCPVLLIVGDEDDHAPVITVLQAHQIIENSRLCVVPKAWHAAFLDNYEVTSAAIFPFINSPLKDLTPSKKVSFNSK